MRTLLVTGGAGFIGTNFVRLGLRDPDCSIVVVDNLTYAGRRENLADLEGDKRYRFVRSDIRDAGAMRSLFAETKPQALVNFAAESHVDRSIEGPRPFVETNVNGTFELLEAARHYVDEGDGVAEGDGVGDFRFLHVSTDEVFGSLGPTGRFEESSRYDPRSPYAASKAAADHLVRAYHHTYGLATLITNCSNNYGPYQLPEKLIPVLILKALAGADLPIYGDGSNVRDWIHVEDHCRGILRVLEAGTAGESYNIGADSERTNLQIVEAICAALEERRPARSNSSLADRGKGAYFDLVTFVEDRPGHDRRYAIDASKVRTELDWRPARDFETALRSTIDWYLNLIPWRKK